jgi:hypothetical protein
METEFGVDFGFETGAVESGAWPGAEAAEDGHGASMDGHRIRRLGRGVVPGLRRGQDDVVQKDKQDGGVKPALQRIWQVAEWRMDEVRALFVPQGLHGICAHGAAAWEVGSDERGCGQDSCGG